MTACPHLSFLWYWCRLRWEEYAQRSLQRRDPAHPELSWAIQNVADLRMRAERARRAVL